MSNYATKEYVTNTVGAYTSGLFKSIPVSFPYTGKVYTNDMTEKYNIDFTDLGFSIYRMLLTVSETITANSGFAIIGSSFDDSADGGATFDPFTEQELFDQGSFTITRTGTTGSGRYHSANNGNATITFKLANNILTIIFYGHFKAGGWYQRLEKLDFIITAKIFA